MKHDEGRVFRKLARNSRLANYRLHETCMLLSPEEFVAPRTSFFPTIRATLNHIYLVDVFYFDALKGGSLGPIVFQESEPYGEMRDLRDAQARLDDELISFVDRLDAADLEATVHVYRGARVQQDRCDDILSHLFQHQTHHRGQVHAMLSGTSLKPPQLDEFIVGDDADVRKTEIEALGWSETDLMFPGRF